MKFFYTFFACLVVELCFAQNPTKEMPYAIQYDLDLKKAKTYDSGIDHYAKRKEFCKLQKVNTDPTRGFTECIRSPNLNIKENGFLFQLETGRQVWLLKVVSKHAKELHFAFDNFHVGTTASLFIFSKDRQVIDGRYDNRYNSESGSISAGQTYDHDELYIEYSESETEPVNSQVILSEIWHRLFARDEYVEDECRRESNSDSRQGMYREKEVMEKGYDMSSFDVSILG